MGDNGSGESVLPKEDATPLTLAVPSMNTLNPEQQEQQQQGGGGGGRKTLDDNNTSSSETQFIAYKRRFLILITYILGYFFWNWGGGRQVILAPSYAKFHNITTELSFPSLGVDFLNISTSLMLLVTYSLAAFCIDRFGLHSLTVGNFGLCIANWIWWGAGTNFNLVVLSIVISSIFGPLVSVSILAISNRWFPEKERVRATAAGTLTGLIGGGAAVVAGPFFETGPSVVDFTLLSCKSEQLSVEIQTAFAQSVIADQPLFCNGTNEAAFEKFCCYAPANIPGYNLFFAIVTTIIALFSLAVVRNNPPTPPSRGGVEKDVSNTKGLLAAKAVFTNRRLIQINFVDFLISGPPNVLFSTIARILPAAVRDYDTIMSAAGIALAIPTAMVAAWFVDRSHKFWEVTFGAYVSATVLWFLAAIGIQVGGFGGGVLFIITGVIAIVCFVAWQVSGYELKMEWAFRPDINLEGFVAAFDRTIINLSVVVFVAAIPPERLGASFTLWFGLGLFIIGVVIAALIPNKRGYERLLYEQTHQEYKHTRKASITIQLPNEKSAI